eukprot:2999018-Pyramimonas_sp.AAC.1
MVCFLRVKMWNVVVVVVSKYHWIVTLSFKWKMLGSVMPLTVMWTIGVLGGFKYRVMEKRIPKD